MYISNAGRELQAPTVYVEPSKIEIRQYINSRALQGWATEYMAVH